MAAHEGPRILLALTAVTIVTALVTSCLGPRAVANLPSGFTRPVLAIELVESPEQFRMIAEQPTIDPPGFRASTLIWRSTAADLLFIAAYGLLWLRLLLAAGGRRRRLVQYAGLAAIVVAVAADGVENWGIMHGLRAAVAPADLIRRSATVKWFALALVFLALVERFWTERSIAGRAWRILNGLVSVAYGAGGILVMGGLLVAPALLEMSGAAVAAALLLQIPLFAYAGRHAPERPADPFFTEQLDDVRSRELEYIVRRRTTDPANPPDKGLVAGTLVGLSLSGGGIRSATTNLGILQALSRMGILPLVDYLSTVSGGGYIGSCLTSLLSIRRDAPPGHAGQYTYVNRGELRFNTRWKNFPFNPELPRSAAQDCASRSRDTVGRRVVAHLRTHGNFLIARRGLLKRDALRAVGHLLTGIVYHIVTTLLVMFVAALVLMGIAHGIEPDLQAMLADPVAQEQVELATVTPAGGAAPGFVVTQTAEIPLSREFSERIARAWDDVTHDLQQTDLPWTMAAGAGGALVVFLFFFVVTRLPAWPPRWQIGETQEDRFGRIVLRSAAVVLAAALVVACVAWRHGPDRSMGWIVMPFLVLAGARVMTIVLYVVMARVDVPRRWFHLWSRELRSLWGSFQAMTTYGMLVTLLFALLPVMAYASAHVSVWALVAPAVSLGVSRLLVADSVGRGAARWKIAPGVVRFLLGLAVLVFVGFVVVESAAAAVYFEFDRPGATFPNPFLIALVASGTALVALSLAGDINRISPHYFYRDRLLETYLRTEFPEADKRMATFTDTTNMRLTDMHGVDPTDPAALWNTAPYTLISAAINLPGSRDLTRKDRKSGYFLFSKYYCGSLQTGYRTSDHWRQGETKVSRAITVSGAAVSTAMGSRTFFAEAFVAAVFNVRLGFWMSNPRRNKGDQLVFWPRYMLQEVFSAMSERTPLVNLSDGGHTGDNIGIYPLLERRCQVIIACDAEADPGLSFGSFTEALRHAYVDLGVDVDIDLSMLRPQPDTGLSKSHSAIGRIRYPECPDRPNWLIYLKNSMTGDEPAPVMNYRSTSPAFPHESTADQFFDDAQFESYRALGVHIAEDTFGRWAAQDDIARALASPQR